MRIRHHEGKAAAASEVAEPAFPHPDGWFCAGFSAQWRAGTTRTVPMAGKDVVIYRTRKGVLRAIEPYCPHMGAHLGVGGKVEGEQLLCPFHHFRFSTDGQCVSTPYGKPSKAPLTLLPSQERHGIVWVWLHHAGEPPSWELSDALTGIGDRAPQAYHQVELAGYPQDIAENIADYGHFLTLHGMAALDVISPMEFNGPLSQIEVRVRRRFSLITLDSRIHAQLLGLAGFAAVLRMPRLPYRVIVWAVPFPTPGSTVPTGRSASTAGGRSSSTRRRTQPRGRNEFGLPPGRGQRLPSGGLRALRRM
jgi:nitrite reductase/ring-hydroxylating ferredoxin subunit